MLMGEYRNNLDNKGRLVIPSKLRNSLETEVILTRGLDNSLFLYSSSTWNDLISKIDTLSFTKKDNRNFMRFLLSGALTLEFDKQGRIIIPLFLQEFANLKKECVIIGANDHVEIWSDNAWEKFMQDNFTSLSEISCDLFNSN